MVSFFLPCSPISSYHMFWCSFFITCFIIYWEMDMNTYVMFGGHLDFAVSLGSLSGKWDNHGKQSCILWCIILYMGASMVKWTTPNPCLVLSESDLKLYTNLELCEEINHRHIKRIYKAKQYMMTKNFQEKPTYFRRWCKWCASRWCWTNDCLKFV